MPFGFSRSVGETSFRRSRHGQNSFLIASCVTRVPPLDSLAMGRYGDNGSAFLEPYDNMAENWKMNKNDYLNTEMGVLLTERLCAVAAAINEGTDCCFLAFDLGKQVLKPQEFVHWWPLYEGHMEVRCALVEIHNQIFVGNLFLSGYFEIDMEQYALTPEVYRHFSDDLDMASALEAYENMIKHFVTALTLLNEVQGSFFSISSTIVCENMPVSVSSFSGCRTLFIKHLTPISVDMIAAKAAIDEAAHCSQRALVLGKQALRQEEFDQWHSAISPQRDVRCALGDIHRHILDGNLCPLGHFQSALEIFDMLPNVLEQFSRNLEMEDALEEYKNSIEQLAKAFTLLEAVQHQISNARKNVSTNMHTHDNIVQTWPKLIDRTKLMRTARMEEFCNSDTECHCLFRALTMKAKTAITEASASYFSAHNLGQEVLEKEEFDRWWPLIAESLRIRSTLVSHYNALVTGQLSTVNIHFNLERMMPSALQGQLAEIAENMGMAKAIQAYENMFKQYVAANDLLGDAYWCWTGYQFQIAEYRMVSHAPYQIEQCHAPVRIEQCHAPVPIEQEDKKSNRKTRKRLRAPPCSLL